MSEKQTGDPPPAPEFRQNLDQWARDLTVYLEQQFREIHDELRHLHQVKADAT